MTFANYPSLAGRVVFVTGGASGIGAEMVRAFAANGAKVAFVDIQADAGKALVAELRDTQHRPRFLPVDLIDIGALQASIEETRHTLGPIAVLINNAASDERHELDHVTPDYWDKMMNVNLRHQFFAAQAVRPHMKELGRGSIVNFSSIAWMAGAAGMVAYTTAKSAILGLTKSLGREFGPDNIRVNAIAPGAVVTDKQLRLWYTPEQADEMAGRQAIRRRLLPVDIARVALFLAADDSEMITKQCLIVDGGLR
ncbi:SDR family oxidoreductase [Mesorhizobium sp. BAC0120]|uniref:SDR family NAD(P)-dependent oxidoreductase n=1 Tax=Mesorhizobium sp. BAC0120 TaxID=3090670 RepID=UPI00298C24D6|nr:SDR family oxidoreductase [Mesorhizobium sp. BAC0120]MDW6022582.1 SDR family oxidoreductase [Mesorhizobium sp. BAC0120]